MKVLDRLPYYDESTLLDFQGGIVEVRRYQIILWMRIGILIFPAILDTGHSHNFLISEGQLRRWAGIASLPRIGKVATNGREMPQFQADLWIHSNRPGTREPTSLSSQLKIDEGITVMPAGMSNAPRLPLLGLRAITRSGLKVTIDGKRRQVTLTSKAS